MCTRISGNDYSSVGMDKTAKVSNSPGRQCCTGNRYAPPFGLLRKPSRSKGYGLPDVGNEEAQKKAIEVLQGKEVSGRPIAVKIAVDPQAEEAEADAKAEAEAEVPAATA